MPNIGEIESGLLPTMRSGLTGSIRPERKNDKNRNLEKVLAEIIWPTPHSTCSTGAGNQGRQGGLNIQTAVKLWPTPNTSEAKSDTLNVQNRIDKGKQIMLCHAVRLWPTASARDYKDTPGMSQTGTNPDGTERTRLDQLPRAVYAAENAQSGSLNPMWVEWLQGYPLGWTEVD